MVKKAIIPAAGSGTRLLPATKEQPKEMLPVFTTHNGQNVVKPVLQLVFEKLVDSGIHNFCFITGRTKRSIEDHFMPLEHIEEKDKTGSLKDFHKKLESSKLYWINQYQPKGFGHAVLQAKNFVGTDDVLVHAGDTILKNADEHIKKLIQVHRETNSEATISVQQVENPKHYGVVVGDKKGDIISVKSIVEKPEVPPSNLAVVPIYIFKPSIFYALERTQPDAKGEIQLTDAIAKLVEDNTKVTAVEISESCKRIDIGNVDSYMEALKEIV